MAAYIVKRIFQALIVCVLVSILIFVCLRLLPADPILIFITKSDAASYSPEMLDELRHELGLDKSLPMQYFDWVSKVIRLDLGNSFTFKQKVTELLLKRIPVSFHIGIISFILSGILGVIFGVLSGIRRGTWIDNIITPLSNLGVSLPTFWLGIILIYFFSFKWGWLPTYGYTSPFTDFWLSTKQLVMPVLVLMALPLCLVTRQARSSTLEVSRQDYVRTAWAKGLSEKVVITRHILKNCLIPIITVIGMGVPHIFAGEVLVEMVFNIPGMGRMLVDAVTSLDYNLLQSGVLFITIVVVFCNLVVDISYSWVDPRVRY
jgi:peptide/nickel transport system permease protein